MNPGVVLAAFGLFLACLGVHVVAWRFFGVRRIPALFAIFFLPILPGLAAAFRWPELLGVLLAHAALSCAYIQTYPTLTQLPPTLRLVLLIAAGGREGAAFEDLRARLGAQRLVREIFDPLVVGRLLTPREGSTRLEISARGKALIYPFVWLRALLGLPPGAG